MTLTQTLLSISGWILGPLAGYYYHKHSQATTEKHNADKLRKQIISELENMEHTLNQWPDAPPAHNVPNPNTAITTDTYDTHITELAILSEPETSIVQDFYTDLQHVQNHSDMFLDTSPDTFDYDDDKVTVASFFHSDIIDLKNTRTTVIDTLQNNLN